MASELTPDQVNFLTRYLGIKMPDTAKNAGSGLVKKRGFLISRWQKIPGELAVEIDTLESIVLKDLPHEDAAGFAKALRQALDDLASGMKSKIDSAVDVAVNLGDPNYGSVATAISGLRNELATDAVIVALRNNALAPENNIEATISSALDEVEAALTS
ncbi:MULTISPECIES: hypothetical protein [Sedimentitalea]|uniref:Uncharacterized protein n=1 Tax=Sedimentitalea todarodis TaxID=1631240 RepID=A0ABU3VKY0_9RHOB|nr:hypothetical protein [Sedimentitalea todarodis]MDU9006763.1 hypothetical protein [Sedimentitalea todarodis]